LKKKLSANCFLFKMPPLPYNRSRGAYSSLQKERLATRCELPKALRQPKAVRESDDESAAPVPASEQIRALFPHTVDTSVVKFDGQGEPKTTPIRIACVLSGGQAPGGHNIVRIGGTEYQ
jgi:diphosphate-dependent phosphofructokinase